MNDNKILFTNHQGLSNWLEKNFAKVPFQGENPANQPPVQKATPNAKWTNWVRRKSARRHFEKFPHLWYSLPPGVSSISKTPHFVQIITWKISVCDSDDEIQIRTNSHSETHTIGEVRRTADQLCTEYEPKTLGHQEAPKRVTQINSQRDSDEELSTARQYLRLSSGLGRGVPTLHTSIRKLTFLRRKKR